MKKTEASQYRPWTTPNYVRLKGMDIPVHISEVSQRALMDMCEQFKAEVLAKAKSKRK